MSGRIVVMGATGNLGSGILRHLLELVPTSDIIVSLYNPSKSPEDIKNLGVEIRRGDFNDSASLESAYAGASTVLIVSSPSMDEDLRIKQHSAAVDAAIKAGVRRIVYTSLALTSNKSHVMNPHIVTEEYIKKRHAELGDFAFSYTILREGIYAESYSVMLGFWSPGKSEVVVSGDGLVAFAGRDDLSEATAKILARSDEQDRNKTLLLSGEEAFSLRETTKIFSKALEENVGFRVVTSEEYREYHKSLSPISDAWETTYAAIERGECSETSTLLREVLGRPPVDIRGKFEELAKMKSSAERDAWAASALRK